MVRGGGQLRLTLGENAGKVSKGLRVRIPRKTADPIACPVQPWEGARLTTSPSAWSVTQAPGIVRAQQNHRTAGGSEYSARNCAPYTFRAIACFMLQPSQ